MHLNKRLISIINQVFEAHTTEESLQYNSSIVRQVLRPCVMVITVSVRRREAVRPTMSYKWLVADLKSFDSGAV